MLQLGMFFFFYHKYFPILTFASLCHHMFFSSLPWTDAITLISSGLEKGE